MSFWSRFGEFLSRGQFGSYTGRRGVASKPRSHTRFAPLIEHLEDRRLLAISAEVLRDINLTSNFSNTSNIEEMIRFGSAVIFHGDDDVHGAELWVTEGTKATTRLLIDLAPGPLGSSPDQFVIFNGKLYF